MNNENKFPKGAYFNLPHEKAPDFVKGQFNIANKSVFIDWLKSVDGDNVKLSLKSSKEGKGYAELDTYVSQGDTAQPKAVEVPSNFDDMNDDLPF
jgi:hypothetical protein